MQGSPESCVSGRTLLYQLILIQAVCEKKGEFTEVPNLVNNHPMLQESALIDSHSARVLYRDLLEHYGIVGNPEAEQVQVEQVPKEEAPVEEATQAKVEDSDKVEDAEMDTQEIKTENSDMVDGPGAEAVNEPSQPKDEPTSTDNSTQDAETQDTIAPDADIDAPLDSHASAAKPTARIPVDAPVDPVQLDRLVNTLYMKYSQELLEAIAADKQEFNQILATIKPK